MTFEIRWTESSFKKLAKLDRKIQERIIKKLDETAAEPFVIAKKLSGVNLYSVRVGDYCVIVSIEKEKLVVLVIDLGVFSIILKDKQNRTIVIPTSTLVDKHIVIEAGPMPETQEDSAERRGYSAEK